MLPLISASEREDLIVSLDSSVIMAKEDREPARAMVKKDCELNGTPPTIFTVRPLKSREMIRVINATAISGTEGLVRATEIGVAAIMHNGRSATEPQEIDEMIDLLPHQSILAVGAWLIEQSSLPEDPTEPDE